MDIFEDIDHSTKVWEVHVLRESETRMFRTKIDEIYNNYDHDI